MRQEREMIKTAQEQTGHITKKEKLDKQQLKNMLDARAENTKFGTLPATEKSGSTEMFWLLVDVITVDTPLEFVDNFQLNLLAINLKRFAEAEEQLSQEGLTIDGKKNPLVNVSTQYFANVTRLFKDLGITRNERAKLLLNQIKEQSISDPVGDLIG